MDGDGNMSFIDRIIKRGPKKNADQQITSEDSKASFRDQVKKQLKGFDRDQICKFAWLCGVRALPFLSARRAFAYWPEESRQKHLFAIFHAIDIVATDAAAHAYAYAYAARAAASAAASAARAADADAAFAAFAARAAANAAFAARADADAAFAARADADAAFAARAAADAADAAAFAADAADAAAAFAARAAANAADAAANAADINKLNIEELLLSDIEAIEFGNLTDLNNDTSIYGEIWSNFLEDLNNVGCSYWARLYEDLFQNRFVIDEKELERRLNVPEEIREQGATAVGNYLTALHEQGAERLNEARVIILGEKGAGKTSLARKLINPKADLPKIEESTEGVDVLSWKLPAIEDTEAINVRIWDFAGHAITHTAHRYFLAERCVYIIVYDGRSESRNDLEKWLNHAKTYGGDSPVYILINIRDASPLEIDENMLMDKFPKIKDFVYLSLLDDIDEMKRFCKTIENLIRTDPAWGDEIPSKWFIVKQNLEERFAKEGSELIGTNEFNVIAKEAKIEMDDVETMKRALHALGICLWYSKITDLQTYVLNPNWISYGVYKIINWLGKRKDYKLHLDDLSDVFHNEKDTKRYPKDKHRFLFELLIAYELAYPIKEEKSQGLILPSMLPSLQPEKRMEDSFPIKESLLMRYKVSGIMPIGTIAQFIVRFHERIVEKEGKQVVWRHGVSLRDQAGNEALVIEDGLEIRLSVKGKTALTFFSLLRSTLNEIFQSYKGDNTELEYVITETNQNKPIYADDGTILAFAINDRLYIEAKTGKEINMIEKMNKYNISHSTIIDSIISQGEHINTTVNLPATINEEAFTQILDMLKEFLNSEQADDLKIKDARALQDELTEAIKLGHKNGWQKFREWWSDFANTTTIGTALYSFLVANPGIPEMVRSIFIR